jgi:hypothetical protein
MAANLETHRTVRAISIDLDLAIAFYETYVPSGQDATLIDRINKVDFYPAFNIISVSLHQNVIMTLCRIWDTRTDTADLNSRWGGGKKSNKCTGTGGCPCRKQISFGNMPEWRFFRSAMPKPKTTSRVCLILHELGPQPH